ncbi:MAG: preprotein translocase subunit SecG [Bacilli bacterium]|nr:preprotein translocase subunit SecG [Bacilli bacterium]
MKTALLIISILLIVIVLLQSGKAEGAAQIISGGSSDLFTKRKERGSELVISRVTLLLGLSFFLICLISTFVG